MESGTTVSAQMSQSQVKQVVQAYIDQFSLKDLDGSALVLTNGNFSYTWANTACGLVLNVSLIQVPYKMMLLPNISPFFGASWDGAFYLNGQTSMAAEWSTPPGP